MFSGRTDITPGADGNAALRRRSRPDRRRRAEHPVRRDRGRRHARARHDDSALATRMRARPMRPPRQFLPIVIESQHSRFPVIGDDVDDVRGILHAKDILPLLLKDEWDDFDIKDCMRPAAVIPESKRLNVLLQEFPREPQSHGRGHRRIRPRQRRSDDRGRARADRRRHRRRARRRRQVGHQGTRRGQLHRQGDHADRRFQRTFRNGLSTTRSSTPSAAC